jgi:hypothetical protein
MVNSFFSEWDAYEFLLNIPDPYDKGLPVDDGFSLEDRLQYIKDVSIKNVVYLNKRK